MQIRRLDPADPDAITAWHATYSAGHAAGLEHPSPRTLEEMRAGLLGDLVGERLEPFGGYVDGRPVVTGVLQMPLMDNLQLAGVDVSVHPDARGRGHGSVMLEHLTDLARSNGRTTMITEAEWPYDAPADGAGQPTVEFLVRHDFRLSLGNIKRSLDLPVDDVLLDRLAREAAPYHRDYLLRDFRDPVPEDLVDGFAGLIGSLITEAPTGDLDLEPEVFDASRIRMEEKVLAAAGRTKYTTVALTPAGEVVAYSDLVVPAHDPGRVYQWGTLVRSEHRGHRLGVATKVHNLRRLQEQERDRTVIYTYNADVNAHMVAVNDAMGFRPVQRLGEFQKKL